MAQLTYWFDRMCWAFHMSDAYLAEQREDWQDVNYHMSKARECERRMTVWRINHA